MNGEFSVYQFFPDESYERVREFVDAKEAVEAAHHYCICDSTAETREVIRSVKHRRPVAYVNISAEILAHRMVHRSNLFDELLACVRRSAAACAECNGTGTLPFDDTFRKELKAGMSCPDCAEERAVIAKAEDRS